MLDIICAVMVLFTIPLWAMLGFAVWLDKKGSKGDKTE